MFSRVYVHKCMYLCVLQVTGSYMNAQTQMTQIVFSVSLRPIWTTRMMINNAILVKYAIPTVGVNILSFLV